VFAPAFGAGQGAGNDVAQGFFAAVVARGLLGVLELLESLPDMPANVLEEARSNWSRQDDAAMRACVTALADAVLLDDLDDLAHVDMPTLVVGHQGDQLHPWALAESYAEALPQARLVGFGSSAEASPEQMATLLVDFVSPL
jgi:pimeloyl-ACP methyl ester carboxylesterase